MAARNAAGGEAERGPEGRPQPLSALAGGRQRITVASADLERLEIGHLEMWSNVGPALGPSGSGVDVITNSNADEFGLAESCVSLFEMLTEALQ